MSQSPCNDFHDQIIPTFSAVPTKGPKDHRHTVKIFGFACCVQGLLQIVNLNLSMILRNVDGDLFQSLCNFTMRNILLKLFYNFED